MERQQTAASGLEILLMGLLSGGKVSQGGPDHHKVEAALVLALEHHS